MRIEMDKIYCGDSLQVLQTLPENAVDCCVTSPPYYALRDYGADGQIGREATPDWDLGKESWSAQGAAMGDLVPLGTYIAAPATAAEIDESVRYMLASNQNTLVLQYPSLSVTSARRVMEAALAAVKTYCDCLVH